jgi:glycosyltransferase involved in cell wall biosynthesis
MQTIPPRRLRVLFIVNSLRFGGVEKHVVTLLNQLDRDQFDLSLVYLKDERHLLPQLDQTRLQREAVFLNVQKKIDWAAVRRLAALIRELQIDVLLCSNNYPLWYGSLVRLLVPQKLRLVEVLHTTELNSLNLRLQFLFSMPFYWASHRLVYVCENQRQHWRKRALSRWRDQVIHNGIDIDFFSPAHYGSQHIAQQRAAWGAQPDDFVIGICAVFRPEKAHGDLLLALAALRAQGHSVKACLIGDGVERPRLEAKIVELGLAQAVTITGFQDDVRPLIVACDAIAIVSTAVETFSIAALESMALGKAMIMSDIGGASEQVEPGVNGYLFPAGDVAALSQAILQLMSGGQCQAMGQRARDKVCRDFSLQGMVGQYQTMLLDVGKLEVDKLAVNGHE